MKSPNTAASACLAVALATLAGCGAAVSVDPALLAAADELQTTESAEQLRDVGDGLAARRQRIPELFPEVATLIAAGSQAAPAILPNFAGSPGIDEDESLSIYAYALEQIGDSDVVPDLVDFLRENTTGEVVAALSAATHAVRHIEGLSNDPTAAYLMSEIEETIATASGDSLKAKLAPLQQASAAKQSCAGEFFLLDANGDRIRDAAGKEIRVGGTMFNPSVNEGFAASAPGRRLAAEVVSQGGSPFNYLDPQSDVTFQGEPTRRFNCAGFVFRNFVRGKQWIADPGKMHEALNAAGQLETVDASDARPGDFAFFTQEGKIAHVAEVETADTGILGAGITVINGDGPTGMFRANVSAGWFQKYGEPQYFRWRAGPPNFEPVPDLPAGASCFDTDFDGDGVPELGNDFACTPGGNCDIECINDSDCPPARPACNDRFKCYSPDEVECLFDVDCPPNETCNDRFQCS